MAHLGRPPALLCLLPATLRPELNQRLPFLADGGENQRQVPSPPARNSGQFVIWQHLLVSSTWFEFLFTGASQSSLCLHSCWFFPGWVTDSQLHAYALSYLHRWRAKYIIFFNVYLFLRERERERETQNPKQAPGSEPSAQSPTRGSNSQTARS